MSDAVQKGSPNQLGRLGEYWVLPLVRDDDDDDDADGTRGLTRGLARGRGASSAVRSFTFFSRKRMRSSLMKNWRSNCTISPFLRSRERFALCTFRLRRILSRVSLLVSAIPGSVLMLCNGECDGFSLSWVICECVLLPLSVRASFGFVVGKPISAGFRFPRIVSSYPLLLGRFNGLGEKAIGVD